MGQHLRSSKPNNLMLIMIGKSDRNIVSERDRTLRILFRDLPRRHEIVKMGQLMASHLVKNGIRV